MLTFGKTGKPIARCLGGKYDKKILKIGDDSGKSIKPDDPFDFLTEEYLMTKGKMTPSKMRKVKFNLMDREDNSDEDVDSVLLDAFRRDLTAKSKNEIIINDGKFIPTVDPTGRQIFYLAGASGSGKSYLASQYISEYKRIFPKNKVYVFSRIDEDEILDRLNPIRIKIDDELLEDPIDISQEFKDCLILFDDTDTIQDKDLKEMVAKLQRDVQEIGRHNNIYAVITKHMLMNSAETRGIINESHMVAFFKGNSTYHVTRFLKVYCGLDKNMIQKILQLPSRWVIIGKNYPMYILYESGAFLLS